MSGTVKNKPPLRGVSDVHTFTSISSNSYCTGQSEQTSKKSIHSNPIPHSGSHQKKYKTKITESEKSNRKPRKHKKIKTGSKNSEKSRLSETKQAVNPFSKKNTTSFKGLQEINSNVSRGSRIKPPSKEMRKDFQVAQPVTAKTGSISSSKKKRVEKGNVIGGSEGSFGVRNPDRRRSDKESSRRKDDIENLSKGEQSGSSTMRKIHPVEKFHQRPRDVVKRTNEPQEELIFASDRLKQQQEEARRKSTILTSGSSQSGNERFNRRETPKDSIDVTRPSPRRVEYVKLNGDSYFGQEIPKSPNRITNRSSNQKKVLRDYRNGTPTDYPKKESLATPTRVVRRDSSQAGITAPHVRRESSPYVKKLNLYDPEQSSKFNKSPIVQRGYKNNLVGRGSPKLTPVQVSSTQVSPENTDRRNIHKPVTRIIKDGKIMNVTPFRPQIPNLLESPGSSPRLSPTAKIEQRNPSPTFISKPLATSPNHIQNSPYRPQNYHQHPVSSQKKLVNQPFIRNQPSNRLGQQPQAFTTPTRVVQNPQMMHHQPSTGRLLSQPQVINTPNGVVQQPQLITTPNRVTPYQPTSSNRMASQPQLISTPNRMVHQPLSSNRMTSQPQLITTPNRVAHQPLSSNRMSSQPQLITTPNRIASYQPTSSNRMASQPQLISTPNRVAHQPLSSNRMASQPQLISTPNRVAHPQYAQHQQPRVVQPTPFNPAYPQPQTFRTPTRYAPPPQLAVAPIHASPVASPPRMVHPYSPYGRDPYRSPRPPRKNDIRLFDTPPRSGRRSPRRRSRSPRRSPPGQILPSRRPYPPRPFVARVERSPELQYGRAAAVEKIPPKKEDYTPPSTYKKPERLAVKIPIKRNTRIVRNKSYSEVSEIIMKKEKAGFFNNYAKAGAIDVKDTMANKLALNKSGETLYATGINGSHILNVNGRKVTRVGKPFGGKASLTAEAVRKNHLIFQEPNSNDLVLNDSNLGEVRRLPGLTESGVPIEDLHCYRHSLDDEYMLWRSGQDNLTIVDALEFKEVEVLKQFWTFEKRSSMPFAACASRSANKIVATSQAGPENYILHYYEDSFEFDEPIAFNRPVGVIIPSMYKLTCMEVSFDESRVYIAGLAMLNGAAGQAIVVACTFNQNLKELSGKILNDVAYGTPRRMKRIKGTDILIVGCDRSFAILEYVSGQLIQIGTLDNIHDNEITDFEIRGRYLYSKAFNEPLIKVTEFDALVKPANGIVSGSIISPYSNFAINNVAHGALRNLEKVVVTPDGKTVYTGGRGLHMLRKQGSSFKPVDMDENNNTRFFGLRINPSDGNLVMHEPDSNDIVILDKNLGYVNKYTGAQKCLFPQTNLRNPHHTSEDDTMLWFCGTSTIRIVDLKQMSIINEIPNAIPNFNDSEFGVALRGVSKNRGNQIFLSFVISDALSFLYYEAGIELDPRLSENVLPTFSRVYAMEPSVNKSMIFVSGSTKKDSAGFSKGVLAAVNFDRSFKVIREQTIERFNVQACTAMKRFPDRDHMLLGCFKHLLLARFTGVGFEFLNLIENVHTDKVEDVWISGRFFYSVCKNDQYVAETAHDYVPL